MLKIMGNTKRPNQAGKVGNKPNGLKRLYKGYSKTNGKKIEACAVVWEKKKYK